MYATQMPILSPEITWTARRLVERLGEVEPIVGSSTLQLEVDYDLVLRAAEIPKDVPKIKG